MIQLESRRHRPGSCTSMHPGCKHTQHTPHTTIHNLSFLPPKLDNPWTKQPNRVSSIACTLQTIIRNAIVVVFTFKLTGFFLTIFARQIGNKLIKWRLLTNLIYGVGVTKFVWSYFCTFQILVPVIILWVKLWRNIYQLKNVASSPTWRTFYLFCHRFIFVH